MKAEAGPTDMTSADELTKRLEKLKQAIHERQLEESEIELIELQLERLTDLVASSPSARPSLRDLKGLGKEVWRSVDIDEYLREERRSWR
jgi:hypothetical protein